jgi:hypothetical protein
LETRKFKIKEPKTPGCQRLIPVILATWEAETGRIMVGGQLRQIVLKTLICKITRAEVGRVAQVVQYLPSKQKKSRSRYNWAK